MVTMQECSFSGVEQCISLSNGEVKLVISIEIGPRILFFGRPGGRNLFAVFQEQIDNRPHTEWQSYGGHRLWHSPEVYPRTYYPDNTPTAYKWDGKTLQLTPEAEIENGIRKEIDITLDPVTSTVDLAHRIRNTGPWKKALSAWCLSVMAPEGEVIIPQEVFKSHPETLVPARPLVLWHFTRMNDPRFNWGDRYICMREDADIPGKQKIGVRSRPGWAAYRLYEELFIKLHDLDEEAVYPDMGCNAEFYIEKGFLEIETLSPLKEIEPGETIHHRERWGLYSNFEGNQESDISEAVLPKVKELEKRFRNSQEELK